MFVLIFILLFLFFSFPFYRRPDPPAPKPPNLPHLVLAMIFDYRLCCDFGDPIVVSSSSWSIHTHTLHLPPDLPVLMLPASSPRKSPVPHILYMNGPIWNSQGTHQHRAAGTIHFGRWRVTEHGRVQTASLTIAPRITVSGADHGAYYEGKLESFAPQSVRAV